jgi:hypothetical protein
MKSCLLAGADHGVKTGVCAVQPAVAVHVSFKLNYNGFLGPIHKLKVGDKSQLRH